MSELKVKASFEYVIIETIAHPAGSEIISPSGILLGVREQGEEPIHGRVVSVGSAVPEEIAGDLLGKNVPLPKGHMSNVPNADLISGVITEKQAKENPVKYVSAHYKAIQAIYNN